MLQRGPSKRLCGRVMRAAACVVAAGRDEAAAVGAEGLLMPSASGFFCAPLHDNGVCIWSGVTRSSQVAHQAGTRSRTHVTAMYQRWPAPVTTMPSAGALLPSLPRPQHCRSRRCSARRRDNCSNPTPLCMSGQHCSSSLARRHTRELAAAAAARRRWQRGAVLGCATCCVLTGDE